MVKDYSDEHFIKADPVDGGTDGPGTGAMPQGDPPIFLREKTFNPELRDLVSKVTSRETAAGIDDDVDSLSEEELIARYHMLFYHAANLHVREPVNPSIDYRSLSRISSEELVTLIREGLDGIGIHSYCILAYHIRKKCLIPVINTINDLDVYSLYFDVHDGIYQRLRESPDGIFVKRDDITADDTLAARFTFVQGTPWAVYCNTFHNLYTHLLREPGFSTDGEYQDKSLSPVLMIRYQHGAPDMSEEALSAYIRDGLSPALLMYTQKEIYHQCSLSMGTVQHTYYMLEYLQKAYSLLKRGSCFQLSFLLSDLESYYTTSYLLSLLYAKLSGNSIICRLDRSRIIILSSAEDVDELNGAIDGMVRLLPGLLDIKKIGPAEGGNRVDLVRELMFK